MSRKRQRRARTKPPAPAPLSPVPRDSVSPAASRTVVGPIVRCASRVLFWAGLVLVILGVAVGGMLRWRSTPGTWPTRQDVGLSLALAAGGVVAMVISSVALQAARRLVSRGSLRAGVGCAVAALLLALLVLAARTREYYGLYESGISIWDRRGTVYDEADVYYVHAVKLRLRQLARDLESRQAGGAGAVSSADERRLALVTALQSSLVGWTEQEVGHWLDDAQLQRDLMEVMAFQVCPTERRRAAARERMAVEQGDLSRRRQWFAALQSFCREKTPADPGRVEELVATLRRLGASQWEFAHAVMRDAADATLIGERLNQIQLNMASMDAREAFVHEYFDPLASQLAAPGLNRDNPGMRLPVSFPCARAWTAGYGLMSGLHSALVLGLTLVLGWSLAGRGRVARAARIASLAPYWHVAAALSVVVFVVLYVW